MAPPKASRNARVQRRDWTPRMPRYKSKLIRSSGVRIEALKCCGIMLPTSAVVAHASAVMGRI
jgi:hypothetical protein